MAIVVVTTIIFGIFDDMVGASVPTAIAVFVELVLAFARRRGVPVRFVVRGLAVFIAVTVIVFTFGPVVLPGYADDLRGGFAAACLYLTTRVGWNTIMYRPKIDHENGVE
ncbi:hypothetical protein A2801_00935 [Candidatus Woesebacteria bacterium RIFCSPHIGHO2_01_FULL_41_10]|uniref:Uncharacterized protein n=1 Tax=Candidatus Woesebacteria bacterium RIFCSPHIGHO2_01_FULL_41_10 TaxID=1802500 RepID=A0A1F7YMD0_9BACT|nr:MAG: hypothetical protein A2801_00935 [Candidatus Woesebacteria bacterium RIFCSPHIGHO2_01_FULL_41_10]